ncbi:T9SS type A sorting domain-containing protein [Flavobacterium sp. MAH-1]|uniref:T9SS type A sorting domain-containing protein n=1 Tax=Flavobacterium agri TaxID=2743471 RepID=A0A7Y8Y2Y2_9FLAO|nr:T9SS type A sorting domain-containing protein [Flavobacterium agri]NUY81508.1 T9SS type A sorting domain-containing protein [Flavobacterium agri]NYA71532.1 T9SS type A sorting domain-containing protein [Flavobacterium agri]
MKKFYAIALLLSVFGLYGQLSLEHNYSSGSVTRKKFEYSGEKYYVFNRVSNTVEFYNADHSPWKQVTLPLPTQGNIMEVVVVEVSDSIINQDEEIEIAYWYSVDEQTQFYSESKVITSEGDELFSAMGVIQVNIIPGLSPKIFVIEEMASESVYSLPGFTLEQTFPTRFLRRGKMEISGEKYFYFDDGANLLRMFNVDFSVWKTINAPKPANYLYDPGATVSETLMHPDAQIEAIYLSGFYDVFTNTSMSEIKVVNESETLLELGNDFSFSIDQIEGLQPKLVLRSGTNQDPVTGFYGLPGMQLEHEYQGAVYRRKFELSGEKYLKNVPGGLEFHNSDHSFWKSVSFPVVPDFEFDNTGHISENLIQADSQMEFVFSYRKIENNLLYFTTKVAKEDGTILNTFLDVQNMQRSDIEGLDTKFIGVGFAPNFSNDFGSVYSINALKTPEFNHESAGFYPNPASQFVHFQGSVYKVRLFDVSGRLVKAANGSLESLDVSDCPNGVYVLQASDSENRMSVSKLVISR